MAWKYICKSKFPYSIRVLSVDKKNEKLCIYVRYKMLNKIIIKNNYHLHQINEFFNLLGSARYFS